METTRSAPEDSLHDNDFYSWTQAQAEHIRHGRMSCVDLENIAEEIESLGKSQLSALTSSYRLIAMHLLKIMRQPDRMTSSWAHTINRERGNIELLLDENPGMKPKREALFAKAYAVARRDASFETGLRLEQFPEEPAFSLTQVEARDFWPKGADPVIDRAARENRDPSSSA